MLAYGLYGEVLINMLKSQVNSGGSPKFFRIMRPKAWLQMHHGIEETFHMQVLHFSSRSLKLKKSNKRARLAENDKLLRMKCCSLVNKAFCTFRTSWMLHNAHICFLGELYHYLYKTRRRMKVCIFYS